MIDIVKKAVNLSNIYTKMVLGKKGIKYGEIDLRTKR